MPFDDIRWLAPAAIIVAAAPECLAAQYMTIDQARGLIFPQAKEYVPAPVTLSAEQVEQIEHLSGVKVRVPNQPVWEARTRDGVRLGWFILDQVIGKRELITYAVGINSDGKLRQFQIVEYKEYIGYQVKELKWRDQFVGKTLADPLELGVDIINISGATLSCRHVTEGLKRLLAFHQVALR
jgi:Na+-translocating ferredoxin:NAD+ oxidoreductase RnfG subunit